MNPELDAAHQARVPYLEPADLGDHEGRTMRMPELTSLQESYETQVYLQDGVLLRPLSQRAQPLDVDTYSTRWILTGWNAEGAPGTHGQQMQATDRLQRHIVHAGGRVVAEGVTTAPDRRWLEDHLVATNLRVATAVRLGLEAGQPAVVAWTADALTVVPTGLSDEIEGVSLAYATEEPPSTCPMRADDLPGALCAQRGGPWISRSIHAAAIWGAHRRLVLDRLGCRVCADGSLPVLGSPGRATSFRGMVLPSRYGGWAWA